MERPWVTSALYDDAIKLVVKARRDANLSQREVASRLKKPRSFVSKIETKERRLDFVEFVLLSHALGVSPITLLKTVQEAIDAFEFSEPSEPAA